MAGQWWARTHVPHEPQAGAALSDIRDKPPCLMVMRYKIKRTKNIHLGGIIKGWRKLWASVLARIIRELLQNQGNFHSLCTEKNDSIKWV